MANYLHRLDKLEAQHAPPAELPLIVAIARSGEDADAVVAEALRQRGLKLGEARVAVVSFSA